MPLSTTVLRLLRDAPSREEGVGRALDAILAATSTTSGTVHVIARGTSTLRLAAARNIPEPVLPRIREIPVGKGMGGMAAQSGRPVQTCNLQVDDLGGALPEGARATGVQGAIAVPMLHGMTVVGVLGVAADAPREFRDEEIEELLELGRVLAGAFLDVS